MARSEALYYRAHNDLITETWGIASWFPRCVRPTIDDASERGPSAPVPSDMYENWAGVDMMYYLGSRWRRQALVYFGEPQDLVI